MGGRGLDLSVLENLMRQNPQRTKYICLRGSVHDWEGWRNGRIERTGRARQMGGLGVLQEWKDCENWGLEVLGGLRGLVGLGGYSMFVHGCPVRTCSDVMDPLRSAV